jgi:WD40 repeat protein
VQQLRTIPTPHPHEAQRELGKPCLVSEFPSAGQERLRITAAPAPGRGEAACIWALAPLRHGALASASSRGTVQIWETQFGTLLSACSHHQADTTCVAATPDATAVFAAGVDPSLVLLRRVATGATLGAAREGDDDTGRAAAAAAAAPPDDGTCRYQYSDRRRPHSSDVRALAIVTPPRRGAGGFKGAAAQATSYLVSGGNDAQLLVHNAAAFGRIHPVRPDPVPCAPAVAVSDAEAAQRLAWGAIGSAAEPQPRLVASSGAVVDVWDPPAASAIVRRVRSSTWE